MKHTRVILKGLVALVACLGLVFTPLSTEAKKKTNPGNGNGNGNSGNTTGTTATGTEGTGHLALGGPGVGLDYVAMIQTPFAQVSDIGRYYRYTFSGIEVQCDADGVPGSYSYDEHMWDTKQKNNNGHGNNCDGVDSSNPGNGHGGPNGQVDPSGEIDDECNVHGDHDGDGTPNHSDPDYTGGHFVFGWWSMWAKVNSTQLGNLQFTTPKIYEQSPIKRMYFSSPVVFTEQNITLEWHGDGNCKDPDGHFYILGSAIKEPPVPRGELSFSQTYYEEGATPQYGWSISRE